MGESKVPTKYVLGALAVVLGLFLANNMGYISFAAAPAATPTIRCGDGICNIGETVATCPLDCRAGTPPTATDRCGDGVCGQTESQATCPSDCTIQAGLTCPSDATTSFELNVRDILNETGYNRLAVTVKKIGPTGQLIDEDTSSTSASTIMKVPCAKATYKLIAYNDDNSGIDIYPAEVSVNGYTIENGALAGGRIPVTINAMQQGTLATACYDSSGSGSTDVNITFTAGETNPYTRCMVSETEDDKAAANIMCMMNYTTTSLKNIELNGNSPAGLTFKTTSVPTIYSGDGGYEKAWNLLLNNEPLTLDADSRTSNPDRVYFDIVLYSYSSTDPGANANRTFRCIDRMRYWEADGVTWAKSGEPAAEDDTNTNLGIAQASEGTTWVVYD